MALLAGALPAAFSLGLRCQKGIREFEARNWVRRRRNMHRNFKVYPVKGSNSRQKAPLGVDTRIHWENENESCLGKSNSQSMTKQFKDEEKLLNEKFSDLLNRSFDYYYQ
ncbi:unnamed protein product [Fraxinus pennsylvanica]|uniref:Uncharacterized protein n=1 Tax=Fraxinus pennsylvanica TaxID=56036 RepID=A0AAD2E703_9LAMI|nr:unnamed protein product [Fraxinus pennsylvanica]